MKNKRRRAASQRKKKCKKVAPTQPPSPPPTPLYKPSTKYLRRSPRLIAKSDMDPNDMWIYLPLEIKFKIFNLLEAEDLGKLALTSKRFSGEIYTYIQSTIGLRHLSNDLLGDASLRFNLKAPWKKTRNAKTLGLLIKACSSTFSKERKIIFAYDMVLQLGWTWDAQDEDFYCNDSYFMSFGEFVHAVVKGWNKSDLTYAFPFIQRLSGMDDVTTQLLSYGPGRFPYKERALRLYFKYVYFMTNERPLLQFWLGQFLRNFTFKQQARLMYIFFGPTRAGEYISWSSALASNCLSPYYEISQLGDFIRLLCGYDCFSEKNVSCLIDALLVLPQPWHPFHAVHLLISCGLDFLTLHMSKVFSLGGYNELAILVLRCVWLLYMVGNDSQMVRDALESVCNKYPHEIRKYTDNLPVLLDPSVVFSTDERDLWNGSAFVGANASDVLDVSYLAEEPSCRCTICIGGD